MRTGVTSLALALCLLAAVALPSLAAVPRTVVSEFFGAVY